MEFLAIQMSKEHLSETLDKFLIVLRQGLLGKPKQQRQLSKDSAQYPLVPTSTAKKDTFQPFKEGEDNLNKTAIAVMIG